MREANYKWQDKILGKWGVDPDKEIHGCGNVAHSLIWKGDADKPTFTSGFDMENIHLYQKISSHLLLYRLAATFEATIQTEGSAGYKCVWTFPLAHQKTGYRLCFGEHKGASSFWTEAMSHNEIDPEVKEDILDLISYLTSDECAHPYDGLTAGEIA